MNRVSVAACVLLALTLSTAGTASTSIALLPGLGGPVLLQVHGSVKVKEDQHDAEEARQSREDRLCRCRRPSPR